MPSRIGFAGVAASSIVAVALIAGSGSAIAAKKMTYEEAFAKCKVEISANAPGSDSATSAARSAAGGACMKKYGFRLKK